MQTNATPVTCRVDYVNPNGVCAHCGVYASIPAEIAEDNARIAICSDCSNWVDSLRPYRKQYIPATGQFARIYTDGIDYTLYVNMM